MEQMTGLDFKLGEIAGRIRELREIEGLTAADMAKKTAVSEEEYLACENGRSDLNFAFIYRCALAFGVDVTDIIEGQSPNLKSYTVTRRGEGQRIEKAHGMTYYNLAASFKNRIAEPLYVKSVFSEEAQHRDIELTTHTGQECDLILPAISPNLKSSPVICSIFLLPFEGRKKRPPQSCYFETSAEFKNFSVTRGTTQIAALKPPLLESSNSYAFTQQSRRGSTRKHAFFLPAQKLQTQTPIQQLSPTAASLKNR